jgi:hypothetical protein
MGEVSFRSYNCRIFVHLNKTVEILARQIQGYIQKFPDWVDNEINNNKHSLRSNTKGYGGKTR